MTQRKTNKTKVAGTSTEERAKTALPTASSQKDEKSMSDLQQNSDQTPNGMAAMRQRAEEQARSMVPLSLFAQTPEEIERVLHDLLVHQIELEMQNEELRTAQEALEESRMLYFDLYL